MGTKCIPEFTGEDRKAGSGYQQGDGTSASFLLKHVVCLGLGSSLCIFSDFTHGLFFFSCSEASCLYFTALLEATAKALLEKLQWEFVLQFRKSDPKSSVHLRSWALSSTARLLPVNRGAPAEPAPGIPSLVIQTADGDIR